MYENWLVNMAVVAATAAAVAVCVLTHYEGLVLIFHGLGRLKTSHQRVKVLYSIMCVLILHVIEIWVFGLTIWLMLMWPEAGSASGQAVTNVLDAIYFSAMTYSTVGYGDVAPVGPIRFLAGSEALVGLVLITWSASFTYLEMERFWRRS